jgi:hypothetical protein
MAEVPAGAITEGVSSGASSGGGGMFSGISGMFSGGGGGMSNMLGSLSSMLPGKGAGQGITRDVTSTTNFDPYITSGSQQAVGMATSAANQPWTGMDVGQVVPGANRNQLDAYSGASDFANKNQPAFQQWAGLDSSNASTVGSFMNPYEKNVLDVQKQYATRDYAQQLAGLQRGETMNNAWGGDRGALQESQLGQNYNLNLENIQASGLKQAFDEGQGALERQRAAGMQGQAESEAQLAQTGGALRDISAQQGAFTYGQFKEQRDWEKTNANFLTGVLANVPKNTTTTQHLTQGSGSGSSSGGVSDKQSEKNAKISGAVSIITTCIMVF